ncbi:MAG: aminoacyl-tRNA hydrolase [bacterium]|nr:aminoacyl-tRNA hydrolase [bacterium]
MDKSPPQVKNQKIKLIIGLGNPGPEYKNTYHNAGFLFVDYLEKKALPNYLLPTIRLIKSDVYMNESGIFVKRAAKKYGAKPEEILIAHDDSDLTIGNFKLDFDRGSAGHKGVESIIQILGTKKFWRLRIGIRKSLPSRPTAGLARRSPLRRAKAGKFVLKKINQDDQKNLSDIFEKIAELELDSILRLSPKSH